MADEYLVVSRPVSRISINTDMPCLYLVVTGSDNANGSTNSKCTGDYPNYEEIRKETAGTLKSRVSSILR